MDRLVFTSNATIKEQATARQVLVNDLANVSTVGFKSSYDVALQSIKVEGAGFDTRYQAQTVARDLIRMEPGPVMATGRPLDVALAGTAVLTVQAPNGDQAFTRRGDLKVNIQGQLENGSGHLVLGEAGPIAIPPGLLVRINPDGSIYARDPAQVGAAADVLVGQLRLRDTTGVSLARRDDGLFKVSEKPDGTDIALTNVLPKVIPQALEGSNVRAIEAMTRLIDQSRSFETQIRIIKEMKGLDESGSSMMKAA
ncbi:flagellar basal body rod protein FlgF [Limnohabitans sp. 63ED37-2]|jgi:flagellar basal-body rod protein FlgF|uniref:flagellar basal body rod protein FlgF n=1 Tax=Limnohabitans sp. 63ED37-2 TaxID=1678128 RepID=UPI000705EB8D|nr:flagellar hook-basal body complex protein [Limnohabitans sp. 63ED37-2]ALK88950.1 Flagellar basal-body rod protein FlgF [Limnohabitans sp. 63ED37-2]